MSKIANNDELDAWFERMIVEQNAVVVAIKAVVPGATYSDGTACTRPINVGWRNHNTGEEIRIIYEQAEGRDG